MTTCTYPLLYASIYILGGRKTLQEETDLDESNTTISSVPSSAFQNMRKTFIVQVESQLPPLMKRSNSIQERLMFFFQSKDFPSTSVVRISQEEQKHSVASRSTHKSFSSPQTPDT